MLHNDGKRLNIVDGQQRIITLLLILQAILKHHQSNIKNPELDDPVLATIVKVQFDVNV